MSRELHHLLVQFLLEDVLARVLPLGTGEHRRGHRPRFTRLRIDQEELLLHSHGAHLMLALLPVA